MSKREEESGALLCAARSMRAGAAPGRASGEPPGASRRQALGWMAGAVAGAGLPMPAAAQAARPAWSVVEQAARGQTVYFNAWAGSERINAYLQWAGAQLLARWGVKLEHVKVADTAEVVRRVRAEKAAGRSDGSVDLVWINGENFLAMKREGLLFGPFAEQLPAFGAVDVTGKPTTRIDFSEPVEGYEAPWGMAQLTFYGEAARVPEPPRSAEALLAWARRHPGRFTYPRPPAFHGTTFVKQVLTELTPAADRAALVRPLQAVTSARLTAALWAYLDQLHPLLWRQGQAFPASNTVMRQMLVDGELLINLTFNPNEAASEIAAQRLPAGVVSWQHTAGTLGNTHFLAIPANARAKEGAQVLANFLLSPVAQARKADLQVWGDPTVLAIERLAPAERALFAAATAPGRVLQPAPTWPEPHASWVDPLEREWTRRYGV